MLPQWLLFGIFLGSFLLIVVVSQWMFKARVPTENSRKFVHVAGGILAHFLYVFDSHWYVLGLCSLAFLLLLITWIRKELPGIHQTKRKSYGSFLFPVPVYICFWAAQAMHDELFLWIPLSLLTFSDTIAEWTGKKLGKYTPAFFGGRKTLAGSLGFAASALVIMVIYVCGAKTSLPTELIFSMVIWATLAEALSLNGFDNITVPVTAIYVLKAFYPVQFLM